MALDEFQKDKSLSEIYEALEKWKLGYGRVLLEQQSHLLSYTAYSYLRDQLYERLEVEDLLSDLNVNIENRNYTASLQAVEDLQAYELLPTTHPTYDHLHKKFRNFQNEYFEGLCQTWIAEIDKSIIGEKSALDLDEARWLLAEVDVLMKKIALLPPPVRKDYEPEIQRKALEYQKKQKEAEFIDNIERANKAEFFADAQKLLAEARTAGVSDEKLRDLQIKIENNQKRAEGQSITFLSDPTKSEFERIEGASISAKSAKAWRLAFNLAYYGYLVFGEPDSSRMFDEALEYKKCYLEQLPKDIDQQINIAENAFELGEYENAKQTLEWAKNFGMSPGKLGGKIDDYLDVIILKGNPLGEIEGGKELTGRIAELESKIRKGIKSREKAQDLYARAEVMVAAGTFSKITDAIELLLQALAIDEKYKDARVLLLVLAEQYASSFSKIFEDKCARFAASVQEDSWRRAKRYLETVQNLQERAREFLKNYALKDLVKLNLNSNPFNSELAEAYEQGFDAIKAYLRAKEKGEITLNEAKLILVGEGEVGKTCLTDALVDDSWQEHDSTHGIQIKSVSIIDIKSKKQITLNTWDFGGQPVYRPTHQLFFSAPAVYLVVWNPRMGAQQNLVKEWIQLVKRREPSAKILVVATHGGPQQRQPDIDRQELWDLFGRETVVDFFFVDSKPDAHGQRKGIDELKSAIAQVAASLPEVGRSVPKSFADVRAALQATGKAYLPLRDVLDICRAHNMDDEIARLFITISHRLGHLTHYENDPTLRDIVILRPDWLATAMSYVLDDEETRAKHGLVNFSRLSHLWDDETRAADSRYEATLHPIFLRLMERFDLSYRVADPTSRNESNPISLIGQLVPDIRPQNLSDAWQSSPAFGDIQQTQICHIVDAGNGQSASAEGLFYQLIVRLHKYSLGRVDYNASVHWQRGLVLEDEYKSRAFLEHVGNDVRITVRSPYPEGLLGMLTREVKFLVESFWEGLRCDVMVPCLTQPCIGLFEVGKLMENKRRGRPEVPCIICNEWQNINRLLSNAPAASQAISMDVLLREFAQVKDSLSEVKTEINVNTKRVLSQVDKTYTDLLQVLTDEAKEGPRLFSFFPVDRSAFNPENWIREKFRLVLWCEHSRLPLPVLNNGDMKKGVYDLELDREWFKKSAPYLKFLTGTLGMVLPVASSAVKLALDETAYKLIEEQLDFGKSIIDSAIGETTKISDFLGTADSSTLEHGIAARADGSTLRELHALLKAKDPGFGGLKRVMNKRQEFLWVHEKFAGEY